MKFHGSSSSFILFLSSLYVLPSCAVSVYLHPTPASSVPARLDAPHASFALARHLGLERFEKIGEGDGIWLGGAPEDGEALIGSAPRDGLLVSMSEDDARGTHAKPTTMTNTTRALGGQTDENIVVILPKSLRPTFMLPTPPVDTLAPLISTYLHRAPRLYNTVASSSSISQTEPSQLVNIFSAPTEANRAFLTSASALIDFLDTQASTSPKGSGYDSFGAFELSGLQELAEQYGVDSESYNAAVATLQAIFASALSRDDLHLALLTFSPISQLSKRDDPPQAPLPPILHPAEPIGSACFTDEEACSNATDSCSGHGECVGATKAGKTCYVCACSASMNDKGKKEDWAGLACERKDISG